MAKNIGNTLSVETILKDNSVMVEVGGSLRRIRLDKFMNAIQTGGLDLSLYAWGVPLAQNLSSQNWGVVGNRALWNTFKSRVGRYQLSLDGSKMSKLSKTNSNYHADGTAVDDSKGNIMVSGPRLYFLVKKDANTGVETLWGSEMPISEHYVDAPLDAAYWGFVENGKLRSVSDKVATRSQQIRQFWNLAHANGNGYGLSDYERMIKYCFMLNLFEYGNPNVQENIGYGCCGDDSTWDAVNNTVKTGATSVLGDSCGAIDISSLAGNAKSCRVSLFGFEDLWGLYWNMVQGIYFGNSNNDAQNGSEVFVYKGNRMPTDDELATHPNGDYRQFTRLTTGNGNYIQEMIFGEFMDIVPKKLGGGSGSYLGDAWWASTTGQLCLWGGTAAFGTQCGLGFSSSSNAFSHSNPNSGARLAYYGSPKVVNGAEM